MKIKIKGNITMLASSGSPGGGKRAGMEIELRDSNASTLFAKVYLAPEQLASALSRLAHVECEIDVFNLERVGKVMEMDKIEFPMPKADYGYGDRKKTAEEFVTKYISDGWILSDNFSSQGSFFTKDGENYARATVRRWVDEIEGEAK